MIRSQERTKSNDSENELIVTIDNGDLKLVDSLVDAYEFKDRDSLFKFAIAALLQGNNDEGLFTVKTNSEGRRVLSGVAPSSDMLKEKTE